MDPRKKLSVLKESLESGVIKEDEFEKAKKGLDSDIKEFDKKVEEMNKSEPKEEEPKKSSDKTLVISIIVIALVLIAILSYNVFFNKEEPQTLEDLHILNLKGKLKASQGYVYKGVYSFVTLDDLWYTQLNSPGGTKIFNLALRYSPADLEDIVIEGNLDDGFFDEQGEFYVTFNPVGDELSYVSLAVADFGTHMSKVFLKKPIAACDRNETLPCLTRPIVTCDDTDKLVLYVKESARFRTYYNNNCIVVEGSGFDLVKGVDRILYNLYTIMGQEEV
ncbi:hypothetical protein CMO83_01205 [Candidatus Woesearchaeota archaeon]|jgi:hypothetical protein|nr:hypothetical protein [Candidatus Woesearchaeota archaeon]|tara:strand:+ start:16024 stop:16854 length:831 start_codon:yes stop_codon:yes gene_type:complete